MEDVKLLALCSPAPGCGKSEVAAHLRQNHKFKVVKFAGPLKDMTGTLLRQLGWGDQTVYQYIEGRHKEDPIPELGGVSCRHIMRTLGTEWGRNHVHDALWVNLTEAVVRYWLDRGKAVVIDDCRYPNELEMIRRLGGKALFVNRPGYEDNSGHNSEGSIRNRECDLMLINSGSITELRERVDTILKVVWGWA